MRYTVASFFAVIAGVLLGVFWVFALGIDEDVALVGASLASLIVYNGFNEEFKEEFKDDG